MSSTARHRWPTHGVVLRNSAEEDSLRRALDAVRAQGASYKNKGGLSPQSFFVGLINVIVSSFILGRFPQYYWVYASVKSIAVNYLSYKIKVRAHQRLYLLDLCHVLSFAYSIVTSAALLAWFVPQTRAILAPFTSSPTKFRAIFAFANGPLGWAVPTLANALVLHSVHQTAALFIHISPPLVTWAMRWHALEHETAFPGLLGVPVDKGEEATGGAAADVPYVELVTPALCIYALWWILFTTWMLLHGRHHGHCNSSGSVHDTVYHMTMRGNVAVGKAFGYDGEKHPAKISPVMMYMFAHAAACVGLVLLSPLFWRYYWAHTALVVLLISSSVWNGSRRYFHMMTGSYERRLRALLPEATTTTTAEEAAAAGGGKKQE